MRDREKFWKERDEAYSKIEQLEESIAKQEKLLSDRENEVVKLEEENKAHVKNITVMAENLKAIIDGLHDEIKVLTEASKIDEPCKKKIAVAITKYHELFRHKIYYNISGKKLIYLGFLKAFGKDITEEIK